MVLSDRTIKAEIEAGRIVLDPFDEAMVQPSSVDVRVDRRFRVFNNARYPFIDVRQPMEGLTEAVEITDEDVEWGASEARRILAERNGRGR